MTTTAPPATNIEGLIALPQRIASAWADHDSAAFADVFIDDGTMVLPGVFKQGREEIRKFMTGAFATVYRGSQVMGDPISLSLHEGVGILVTLGGVKLPGETKVAPERQVRATWVAVRRDGEWRLAAYQNGPAQLA